jgi:hypothetical protein
LLKDTNLIGADGSNHRALFLKSIHVNYGQSLFQQMQSLTQVMERAAKRWTELEQV